MGVNVDGKHDGHDKNTIIIASYLYENDATFHSIESSPFFTIL